MPDAGGRLQVATRRRHKTVERLLVVDESLSPKMAHRLRERGRGAKSTVELGYGRLKDPALLRALFGDLPDAVLVTGDDNMPQNHPLVIKEVAATVATIEPWDRRDRPPLVLPPGLSSDEAWKREVVQRWAHVMAVQERQSIRRYSRDRNAIWKPRIRNPQRRLFR
jgi:hypothetical protein